jgi:hypothetical protein
MAVTVTFACRYLRKGVKERGGLWTATPGENFILSINFDAEILTKIFPRAISTP